MLMSAVVVVVKAQRSMPKVDREREKGEPQRER